MEKHDRIFEIARLIAKEKTDRLSDSENKLLQNWLTENDRNRGFMPSFRMEKCLLKS